MAQSFVIGAKKDDAGLDAIVKGVTEVLGFAAKTIITTAVFPTAEAANEAFASSGEEGELLLVRVTVEVV